MSHCQGLSTFCHTLLPPRPLPRLSGTVSRILSPAPQKPLAQTLQPASIQNSAQDSGLTGTHTNLPTHSPTLLALGYTCLSRIRYKVSTAIAIILPW